MSLSCGTLTPLPNTAGYSTIRRSITCNRRSRRSMAATIRLFDLAAAREMQQRRLYQRVRQSRTQISAPVRVTASVVELSIDGYHLDTISHRAHTDEDINEGLRLFREQSGVAARTGYKA